MTKHSLMELIRASNSKRRYREQTGTVVKRSDGFYIRYYEDRDGEREKVTKRLCDLSTDPRLIPQLRQSFISAINIARHNHLESPAPAPTLTIGAFWIATYLPWAQKNLRHSTSRGYEKCWNQYLKRELQNEPLATYRTLDASKFLSNLATSLNRNSLAHVRSLMSGIFTLAANTAGADGEALIKSNPMRDVKVLVKARAPEERVAYTIEETVAILNALTRTDAKLFFALCAVLGMRPSEVAAVKWENVDLKAGALKVREAAPYGVLGDLKTTKSKSDLLIIEPVRSFLKAWHRETREPEAGLLFTYDGVRPINHNTFAKDHIKPEAEKVCPRWSGCYPGRHGTATDLYNESGDVRAAYQVLRNSLEVVQSTYTKPSTKEGDEGLRKREQRVLAEINKQANGTHAS